MTPKDLHDVLRLHASWLRGESNGVRAYLASANLAGAGLRGAYLASANLASANLASADLRGAYLTSANLMDADLTGADLEGANLMDADLEGAVGNSCEVLTMQTDSFTVVLNEDRLWIGCKVFSVSEWLSLSTDEIAALDASATEFASKWGEIIKAWVKA